MNRSLVTIFACFLTVGCASSIPPGQPDQIDKIYDSIHGQGSDDAIKLLRKGMKERGVYGVTQPSIPVRKNEDVRQIWVPDYVDPTTSRLVHGHWESTVLREGTWYIED